MFPLFASRVHRQTELDGFWTCDEEQARAAEATGLGVKLFWALETAALVFNV
jgi:hypothetical protein